MQFNMGCLGVSFCDYIVHSIDGYRFSQRIFFNNKYWEKMYKEMTYFWENHVNVWVKKYNIEIVPIPYS